MTNTLEISKDQLVDGKPSRIQVGDTAVCVAKIGAEVFAIADTCSHSDASLSEGDISDFKIECWLHGAEFDLRTGEALTPPAVQAVQTFEVQDNGSTVTISKKGN
jgi:3-phenylpropionate/trans-cinnamate dioxygenase ferredoxin subunit